MYLSVESPCVFPVQIIRSDPCDWSAKTNENDSRELCRLNIRPDIHVQFHEGVKIGIALECQVMDRLVELPILHGRESQDEQIATAKCEEQDIILAVNTI